jgi:hypothetical protein
MSTKSRKMITRRYLPTKLSKKDRKTQSRMLQKSIRMYKQGNFYTRRKLKSYPHKKSQHIVDAERIYNIPNLAINDELVKKTGCSKESLEHIVRKGEGAYFSSGSRPNQTAQSWGVARLASSITGGKAAAVDFNILSNGCKPGSKALKMALISKKKYGHGTRRVPKTYL